MRKKRKHHVEYFSCGVFSLLLANKKMLSVIFTMISLLVYSSYMYFFHKTLSSLCLLL